MPDPPAPARVLVGRADELATLDRLLGLDAEGAAARCRAVLLGGDAGVGKTRLLTELRTHALRVGWRVLVGHCLDFGGDELPYLPFREAFGQLAAEAPAAAQQLLETGPALGLLLPGSRGPGSAAPPPPSSARAQLLEDVPYALERLGREAPLLLVVEDLHWADTSTRELLTLLLTRGSAARCVVVASYRADDLHRRHPLRADVAHWSRLPEVTRVTLQPLPEDDVRTLVRALDRVGLPEPAVDRIVARAEGNAFFTEELVAAAVRGEQDLSPDVSDVLLLRLDALEPATRTVLRAMSVAGRQVPHDLLGEVVADEVDDLDGALRTAVDRNVLVSRPEGYAFRHALLGEAVYDDLLPGERVRWHRRYAHVLGAVPAADRRPGTAAQLARHALAAHDRTAAAAAGVRAGDEAMAVGGPAEALRQYEQVLALLSDGGLTGGSGGAGEVPDVVDVSLRACEAATAAGALQRALALAQSALDALPPSAAPEQRVRLLVAVAGTALLDDAPVDALRLTTEALQLAPQGPLLARALAVHARANAVRSRHDEAARWASRAVALARELELPAVVADATTTLTRATWTDLAQAERALRASIADSRAAGDAPAELRSTHNLGSTLYEQGLLEQAQAAYEQAAARAVQMRRPWAPYGVDGRAMAAIVSTTRGRWDEARALTCTTGEDPPELARAVLDAVDLAVAAGRGESAAAERLRALRPWWARDGMIAVISGAAGIDLLGDAGRLAEARELHHEVVELVSGLWGTADFQARIRLSALLLGHLATRAGVAGAVERVALAAEGAALHEAAGRAAQAASRRGPESRAWQARAESEHLRLRRWTGDSGVRPEQLVAAWRAAVEAFTTFGHVFETARSQARLAAALQAAGAAADAELAAATTTAQALGAAPLLRELRALGPPPAAAASTAPALTPREHEVLALVAQGRSNREIGQALFISAKTVSVHISNVLAKLQATSRTEAVALAQRRGLLVPVP